MGASVLTIVSTIDIPDLTGSVFGKLTVLGYAGSGNKGALWRCQCSCGKESLVRGGHLRQKDGTKSCGCSRSLRRGSNNKTHDLSFSPEYRAWAAAISRCHSETNKQYKNYGGRGISVCERWRFSFKNFIYDLGRRTSSEHSLDRINNDGNYEPGNCRWATPYEQANNRRMPRRR